MTPTIRKKRNARGRALVKAGGLLLSAALLVLGFFHPQTAASEGLSILGDTPGTGASDRVKFLSITRSETVSISIGHGSRNLWVYFNPDCSYCQRLWASLEGVSDLTVSWIPVTFSLKKESLARSAAILAAQDPVQALIQNEQHFDDLRERGGFPIPPTLPARAQEDVTKNTMILRLWTGQIATPTLLYKDSRGVIQLLIGLPPDVPAMIAAIGNGS